MATNANITKFAYKIRQGQQSTHRPLREAEG